LFFHASETFLAPHSVNAKRDLVAIIIALFALRREGRDGKHLISYEDLYATRRNAIVNCEIVMLSVAQLWQPFAQNKTLLVCATFMQFR